MKIGYLGPSGSHSHMAAARFAELCSPETLTLLPMMSLAQIVDAVEDGALELGCIPVENAIEGSVGEVLDALSLGTDHARIVADFVRPIQHALIRRYEVMEGIAFVHSHPQAIGQCRDVVYALLGPNVRFVPASSTSEAVKSLLHLDETHAALGTPNAAAQYGLEVLIENIGNLTQNATRFLVMSAFVAHPLFDNLSAGKPVKTSLCLGLHENKPGALLSILQTLAEYQLNMSRIESRPTKKMLGEYLFYLDIEGVIPAQAEIAIQEQTRFYKRLGVYPTMGVLT